MKNTTSSLLIFEISVTHPFCNYLPKTDGSRRMIFPQQVKKCGTKSSCGHTDPLSVPQTSFIQLYQFVFSYSYCGNNLSTTTKTAKAILFSEICYLGS